MKTEKCETYARKYETLHTNHIKQYPYEIHEICPNHHFHILSYFGQDPGPGPKWLRGSGRGPGPASIFGPCPGPEPQHIKNIFKEYEQM